MALADRDLPALFRSADASSLAGQRMHRAGTMVTLGLLVIAAAGGAFISDGYGLDVGAVVAAGAFVIALVVQLELARRRPDREWYDGRAIAESAKSLGWQYAVAGGQYGDTTKDPPATEKALADDLSALIGDLGAAKLASGDPAGVQITAAMKGLREADLD